MPFESVEEAVKKHPNLSKYSAKARRGWLSSFNSAMESGKDESASFAIAYSVANNVDGKKNINDSKKASTELNFSTSSGALQYLSDYTQKRVIIAAEIGDLDIAKFVKQVKEMADVPIDDFVDDVDALSNAAQEEASARLKMENPTQADLLMAAMLEAISKRTEQYRKDLKDMEKIDNISDKYKKDLEDFFKRYQQGVEEVLRQQEEASQAVNQEVGI